MTLVALIGGPLYFHLGSAGAVPGHDGHHRVPRPFARHAPAADPPRLRLPAVAGAAVRLSGHAGRHGRALRHDPPARHPRLGAAEAPLPRLPRAPLLVPARRLVAAALRAATRPSARARHRAARGARTASTSSSTAPGWRSSCPGRCCSSRWAACRGWCGASRVRVAASVTGHWLVGYFAHNRGPRSWHLEGAGVQGYNVPYCGLITMGEAWHNNHHAFPGSARLGLREGEIDPGWWVLLGLAPARPGLGRQDARDAAAPSQPRRARRLTTALQLRRNLRSRASRAAASSSGPRILRPMPVVVRQATSALWMMPRLASTR